MDDKGARRIVILCKLDLEFGREGLKKVLVERSMLDDLLLFSCSVVSHTFVTPWTIAHQAPLSMEFSRPEYWSGLPFPSPRDLPDPGIKPGSPTLQADYHLSHKRNPWI